LLAPRLQRAVQINIKLAKAELKHIASVEALNNLEEGVLFVDLNANSRSRTKQRKSFSRTAIYDKIKVACMPTRPPKRQHFTRSLQNAPNRELSFDRVVSFRYVASWESRRYLC
jgi:hypothetical protein